MCDVIYSFKLWVKEREINLSVFSPTVWILDIFAKGGNSVETSCSLILSILMNILLFLAALIKQTV